MNIIKGFFLLFLMIGIILLIVYFITNNELSQRCDNKIIYKYLPRTLKEEEETPVFVSDIFKTMFQQPSVWINSIKDDYYSNSEIVNKNIFISQI